MEQKYDWGGGGGGAGVKVCKAADYRRKVSMCKGQGFGGGGLPFDECLHWNQ